MKLKEQLGKDSLTPVQRFRCRKRNPPPRHLCPEEIKTRNLPAEARQFLRAWAEGNSISPSVSEREQLIKETGLGKQQIYNWFANYRRRQKRISSQQERDFTRTTICHKRARKLLRRYPQEFSSGNTIQ
ncbi:hypothetical protein scyTo_0021382 [Scyliorhinus torazame]|uniref:Homeobox domain-containing protein n=1 Tax=Scyliorhinus torazame TaxID=75743 RepID=A0A401Q7L9_SCYTO|nr:hypothetical protein [Scyliorhinus torazame]